MSLYDRDNEQKLNDKMKGRVTLYAPAISWGGGGGRKMSSFKQYFSSPGPRPGTVKDVTAVMVFTVVNFWSRLLYTSIR